LKQNHNWQLEMYLARFLNKVFKKGGFILTDADTKDYIIGQTTDDPIKLKILNKKLHYKLLFHPDLYFGEAYTNGLKIQDFVLFSHKITILR
jgi:cyclopropane-fatty-acyl-phospholipid synthase